MDCAHGDLTPELEAEVARVALDQGDLTHAAHHVAGILAADPLRHDWLALFDRLISTADDPLALFPLPDNVWFGQAALHALTQQRQGNVETALPLLCRATVHARGVPYLAWVRSWPLPSASALRDSVGALLKVQDPNTWQLAMEVFVGRAVTAHPDSAVLLWSASIGARRGGDLEGALAHAQASVSADETWMGWIALANAHRALDQWQPTCAAWQRALEIDPTNASPLLDWADTLLDRGDLDDAAARYRQALDREPHNAWAIGSLEVVSYRQKKTVAAWPSLARWVSEHPDNPAAVQGLDQATPWRGSLPWPAEATANVLRQLEQSDSTGARIAVSHLEGPSLQLAVRHASATYSVTAVPHPGPTDPLDPDARVLWTWNQTTASPALPPPSAEATHRVVTLASTAFHSARWLTRARTHMLGTSPELCEQILACVVHPPARPDHISLAHVDWMSRCTHAAAFLLAAVPGWRPDHPPVRALRAMLSVHNDWSQTAALAAVVARAEEEPDLVETALLWAMDVLQGGASEGGFLTAQMAWWAILRLDPDDELGLHPRAVEWIDGVADEA